MSNPVEERAERLILMAARLIEALEGDIAALKSGHVGLMKTTDPEIQRLSAQYGREAQGLSPDVARGLGGELRARLAEITGRFRDALANHARLLTRIRNASEGMIRAVADEAERKAAPMRTYTPGAPMARPSQAMVFNKIV